MAARGYRPGDSARDGARTRSRARTAAAWGSAGSAGLGDLGDLSSLGDLAGLGGLECIRFATAIHKVPQLARSPGCAIVSGVVRARHEHQPAGQGRLPDLQGLGVLG